ncbi:MAG: hypothetical protein AAFS10_17600, partial [Myxococcota bacterium]
LIAGIALLIYTGCVTPESEDKPDAPDMSAILQAYETPTADLNSENMATLVTSLVQTLELIEGTGGFLFLFDVLDALNSDAETTESGLELRRQAITVSGDGFARITRVCNGWVGADSPDPDDGSIDITVGFTESRLDPVVWGRFEGCRYRLENNNLLVEGDVRLWLGDNIQFSDLGQLGQSPFLMAVEGTIMLEDALTLDVLDFRVTPNTNLFEIRLPVDDQHVIFFQEGEEVKFRAANGIWTCDFEAFTCINDNSNASFAW